MVSAGSLCQAMGILVATTGNFPFLLLSRNHFPKGSVSLFVSCVKKLSLFVNNSFISIAFAQYHILVDF